MSYCSRRFTLGMISLACMSVSFAAKPIDLRTQPVSALQSIQAINGLSGYKELSRHIDFNGVAHVRFQQTYAGLPVFGADAVAHSPEGSKTVLSAFSQRTTMNGIIYQGLEQDLGTLPAYLTLKSQSGKALLQVVNLHQQKTGIKQVDSKTAQQYPIVYIDDHHRAHYAYYISFASGNADGSLAVPTYILDAQTFAVYASWDNLQSFEKAAGGGYGGNPKMGKLVYSAVQSDYPALNISRDAATLLCTLKNSDVEVKDDTKASGPFSETHAEKFDCPSVDSKYGVYWSGDLDAVNGGYSPANDAMYIGTVVRNLYQEWYHVPVLSMFGTPMKLVMHVHAKDLYGQKMDNAYFFNLTSQMYFGDGVKLFYPLTSLGVGAHELSHGFTSQHSNLVYEKQSGGLNESYSDMAAQAAEYYSIGKNSWQIGPEIVIGEGALRYMDDPTKDGHSIDNIRNYNDSLNVHYTSGIFNKMFYLIATSSGWNTRKAFDVMVKANMDYWTSKTTFKMAACDVVSATRDYGYPVLAVNQAIKQVGMNPKLCR